MASDIFQAFSLTFAEVASSKEVIWRLTELETSVEAAVACWSIFLDSLLSFFVEDLLAFLDFLWTFFEASEMKCVKNV